jgi:hypothetical protein
MHASARLLAGALALTVSLGSQAAEATRADTRIDADSSEVPELAAWAEAAEARCKEWHPLIVRALGRTSDPQHGELRHRDIQIVVRKEMGGIAATVGATIQVSAEFVQKHPDDDGMIVHELVHVVQAYPDPNPIWLTEGLADYIRYWHYEPGRRSFPIVRGRSSYRDAYGTTARFLAWVQVAKDQQIIHKLDDAMRRKQYRDELFEEATGRKLDDLWHEFVESAAIR